MSANLSIDNGLFCTVTFIKNNGDIRTINGRTGVIKYKKNSTGKNYSEKYILVYTRATSKRFDSPRLINREKIVSIKAQGVSMQENKESAYAKLIRV